MKTKEQIQDYLKSHPTTPDRTILKNIGITQSQLNEARGATGQTTGKHKTLAMFRQQYDIPFKIRSGIASMQKGSYMTEHEFRESLGIHTNSWRRNADLDEFATSHVKVSGQVYWAKPETIQEMKNITGLQ